MSVVNITNVSIGLSLPTSTSFNFNGSHYIKEYMVSVTSNRGFNYDVTYPMNQAVFMVSVLEPSTLYSISIKKSDFIPFTITSEYILL